MRNLKDLRLMNAKEFFRTDGLTSPPNDVIENLLNF